MIGFFLGVNIFEIKVFEMIDVINNGVDEVDMVINIGVLKLKDD